MKTNAEINRASGNGWDYEEHREGRVRNNKVAENPVLLRVKIHADSHTEQCYAHLDALDGLRWEPIVRLHPNDVVQDREERITIRGTSDSAVAFHILSETADTLWLKAHELGITSEKPAG